MKACSCGCAGGFQSSSGPRTLTSSRPRSARVSSRRAADRIALSAKPRAVAGSTPRRPASGRSQPRIERVAERVPEQVEAEHREADRDARGDREPWRLLEELHAGAAEHESPRRRRLEHPETEERERGFEQDRLHQEERK